MGCCDGFGFVLCVVDLCPFWCVSRLPGEERTCQWRSQNAEKIAHIKGRLLDQAVVFFNCVPFQMRNSLKGKS